MSLGHGQNTGSPRQWRSAITNGALPNGIDGRSAIGRRYRDLIAEFSHELAGGDPLSHAELILVRQASAIVARLETLQSDIVNGAVVVDDEFVRLSNASVRILTKLERQRQAKQPKGRAPSKSTVESVADHFQARKVAAARKAEGR